MINNQQHIVIHGWMINDLNLKGNDLLVFAIIYGFSQDGESEFTGSLQYLADWCGATKQGIQKNLKNLLDKNLIRKHEYFTNNVKLVGYTTKLHTIQLSCTNNTYINNITNNIDNKETSITRDVAQGTSFLGSGTGKSKEKKPNLFTKCVSLINEFTDDIVLRDLLMNFLKMNLDMCKESGRTFYTNQFKGKLNQLQTFPKNEWCDIVRQSLSYGWISFYELKKPVNAKVDVFMDDDKERQDKFLDELRSQNKRVEF